MIDFLWRSRQPSDLMVNDCEFQLVTWSKDCDLRLWPITDNIYDSVDYDRTKRLDEKLPNYEYQTYNKEPPISTDQQRNRYKRIKETFVTKSGLKTSNVNHLTWLSGVRMNEPDSPEDFFKARKLQNLGEEVSAIGHKFPKVVFEKISVSTRELVITLNGPWSETNPDTYIFLRIIINFPMRYPLKGNPPNFIIEETKELTVKKRQDIRTRLKDIAKPYTDAGLYCLEPCLRYLLGEDVSIEDLEGEEEPLLNFEIADHIDFDNLSSLGSSEVDSELLDNSSSESELDAYKDTFDEYGDKTKNFGRNLALDTTPVPNECGSVWTASGQLLCFFPAQSKQEQKEQNILKLVEKDSQSNARRPKSYKCKVLDELSGSSNTVRPKRYVDTLALNENYVASSEDDSEYDSSSIGSYDSFADDWDDIMRNNIVGRNKIPALHGNFVRPFGSAPTASIKTGDSSRKGKNVIVTKDFSYLIPDKLELALGYQFIYANPEETAKHNSLVAEEYGYEDISHCWQILSDLLMNQSDDNPFNQIWESHPMGLQWFIKEASF